MNEWQDSHLSLLRETFADGGRDHCAVFDPREYQVSKVWKRETLERWNKEGSFRRSTTLPLPGLWISVFGLVAKSFSLFFSRWHKP